MLHEKLETLMSILDITTHNKNQQKVKETEKSQFTYI